MPPAASLILYPKKRAKTAVTGTSVSLYNPANHRGHFLKENTCLFNYNYFILSTQAERSFKAAILVLN